MTQILTIILEPAEGRMNVHYFISDGITPVAAINALQAVERKFQQEAIEAEVQRRIAAQAAPAPDETEVEP